jgi:NhaA family Na+:H+ antiporter
MQPNFPKALHDFLDSEKAGGILLAACTLVAMAIANSSFGAVYLGFWKESFLGLTFEHWVNDGLMALYVGTLSEIRNALFPMFAAIGGMIAPALIHFMLNAGTPTQSGFGIPMATDIAFALGALTILGSRVPVSLKVFLTAFAVMDDLGAIVIIASVYTAKLSLVHLSAALTVLALLIVLNRLRVMALTPYLIGGVVMWVLMLNSGVHATIAGVALAFAIPFTPRDSRQASPSYRLEQLLHRPIAFFVLPIFALANAGVLLESAGDITSPNGLGIFFGLLVGKPLGVTLVCAAAVFLGVSRLPADLTWRHVFGAGLLGGIGFTMSLFITNLAFVANPGVVNSSKFAILLASTTAGLLGLLWLRFAVRKNT